MKVSAAFDVLISGLNSIADWSAELGLVRDVNDCGTNYQVSRIKSFIPTIKIGSTYWLPVLICAKSLGL